MNNESDWRYQFSTLDSEDRKDPFKVTSEICEYDSLFRAREVIFDLYSIAMGSEDWQGDSSNGKERKMWKMKLLVRAMEVIYYLDQLKRARKMTVTISKEVSK